MSNTSRLHEAYKAMVELGYRPAAPSDGVGNITVPVEELQPDIEAREYARRFMRDEDNGGMFFLGCTDYRFVRAVVWTLEAIHLMNAGTIPDETLVPQLLRMAVHEYEREVSR